MQPGKRPQEKVILLADVPLGFVQALSYWHCNQKESRGFESIIQITGVDECRFIGTVDSYWLQNRERIGVRITEIESQGQSQK